MESSVPHPRSASEVPLSGEPEASSARSVDDLQQALHFQFKRQELLLQALTHRSFTHEQGANGDVFAEDNERLEYLGDAVVGLFAAESLYRRFPDLREGDLTRLRGALVSRKHLAEVAGRMDLGRYLQVGRSERRGRSRMKTSLLANAMEAVIAAVYLDGGPDAARQLIEAKVIDPDISSLRRQIVAGESLGDFKSALQQQLQSRKQGQPHYRTTAETGPDHQKHFQVEVHCEGRVLAEGSGASRKAAEQEAARRALEQLSDRGEGQ
jgi:ribonuclease-3